jgi:hypothetical protein
MGLMDWRRPEKQNCGERWLWLLAFGLIGGSHFEGLGWEMDEKMKRKNEWIN